MSGTGFRHHYHASGPEGYYRAHGDDYVNPHEPAILAGLEYAVRHWAGRSDGVDLTRVLDLAAGGGEATRALEHLAPGAHLEGIDPYTAPLYRRRTGRDCLAVSFEDVARGDHLLSEYSCIVASCALHLAADSWLPPLCLALAAAARDLIVLTPLTRPEIRPEWGWRLREATNSSRDGWSLRLRWYRRRFDEDAGAPAPGRGGSGGT